MKLDHPSFNEIRSIHLKIILLVISPLAFCLYDLIFSYPLNFITYFNYDVHSYISTCSLLYCFIKMLYLIVSAGILRSSSVCDVRSYTFIFAVWDFSSPSCFYFSLQSVIQENSESVKDLHAYTSVYIRYFNLSTTILQWYSHLYQSIHAQSIITLIQ